MTVQHVTIDETRDPNISEKNNYYKDTLYGNLSDPEYIYTESDFDGFIMHEYLPHQRDELPTNKWEEEYQGGYEIPEVDDIDGIHQDENNGSYNGYIGAEVQPPDGTGNLRLRKVPKHMNGINK